MKTLHELKLEHANTTTHGELDDYIYQYFVNYCQERKKEYQSLYNDYSNHDQEIRNLRYTAFHTDAPDLLKENQSLRSELQKQKELNAELVDALERAKNHLDYVGYGDSWERQCVEDLPDLLESLIKKSKES